MTVNELGEANVDVNDLLCNWGGFNLSVYNC